MSSEHSPDDYGWSGFHAVITLTTIKTVSNTNPTDELRRLYPPILTTAHVAEMMHCTIGDVRDKVHRKELKAMRWGQQFRFFRDEVIAAMRSVDEEFDPEGETSPDEIETDET